MLSLNNPYAALLREKVDNYFDTEVVAQYVFGPATYFHRTMEEYIHAFHEADLVLCRLYDVHMTEGISGKTVARKEPALPVALVLSPLSVYAHSRTHQTPLHKEQCQRAREGGGPDVSAERLVRERGVVAIMT